MTTHQRLDDITTPAFIVNRHAFQQNCELLQVIAHKNGITRLRPHVKTHKTREGCIIQAGIESDDSSATSGALVIGFVASTIPEVRMIVELANEKGAPFNDIVYAIPI